MKRLHNLWQIISNLGTDNYLTDLEKRSIIITNRLNFLIMIIMLGIIIIQLINDIGFRIGLVKILFTFIVSSINLFLSFNKFHKISKLSLSILPLFFLLIFPLIFHNVKDEFFFWYPYAAICFSIVPHLIFIKKQENTFYFISVLYYLLLVIFTETLLENATNNILPVVSIINKNFTFIKTAQFSVYIFLNLSFIYTLRLNRIYESKLETINNILQENSVTIKTQADELITANEELTSSNEELFTTIDELNTVNLKLTELNKQLKHEINNRKEIEKSLLESEYKFRSFIEQSTEGILLIDKTGQIIEMNKAMGQIFEMKREDVLNMNILDFEYRFTIEEKKTPVQYEKMKQVIGDFLQGKSDPIFKLENWIQLVSGQRKFINLTTFYFQAGEKSFIGRITRDYTNKKKNEEEIEKYRDHLEDIVALRTKQLKLEKEFNNVIFDSVQNMLLVLDNNGEIISFNNHCQFVTGFSDEEVLGKKFADLFKGDDERQYAEVLINSLLTQKSSNSTELKLISRKGDIKYILWFNTSVTGENGEIKYIISAGTDITEQKEFDNRMFETILFTEEQERKRLAGDLHDEIGPLLSSMNLYISTLAKQELNEGNKKILDKVLEIIKNTANGVREISHNLSPHLLENYGLHIAIKNELDQKMEFFQIDFESNINNIKFETKTEVAIYRIIKELLNNTIKHASATHIGLTLMYENKNLKLSYYDNGIGFDIEKMINNDKKGIGLMNIISRLKSINSSYKMSDSPGNGFYFEMTTNILIAG